MVTPLLPWNPALKLDALRSLCCYALPFLMSISQNSTADTRSQEQRCPHCVPAILERIKPLRKILTMHNLSALLC